MKTRQIYLDYASLTPIDKGVLKVMKKYSGLEYGNPSALYESAVAAKRAVLDARERIAKVLHAHPDEIIFTSGGTEANQLALASVKGKGMKKEMKILISGIEHSSIIIGPQGEAMSHMESDSIYAIKIPVDKSGGVDLEFLKKSLTADVGLVSVMMVNNEIGAIEPIHEIAKIVRDANKHLGTKILFHTDACQAFTSLPIYAEKLGVDMISLDGNKMYGPRGMGMLYVKRGSTDILRPGTENVPGIIGLACAMELVEKMREKETARIAGLKKSFLDGLLKINKKIKVNGSVENSTPHILNISIPSIDNEFFVLKLDAKGIECSTKSACLKDEGESYVLKAIGADSHTSVRFSFGRGTGLGDIKKVLKVIDGILKK